MSTRYAIHLFPGRNETPLRTNLWWRVRLWVWWHWFSLAGVREIRVIDNQTGLHWVP